MSKLNSEGTPIDTRFLKEADGNHFAANLSDEGVMSFRDQNGQPLTGNTVAEKRETIVRIFHQAVDKILESLAGHDSVSAMEK